MEKETRKKAHKLKPGVNIGKNGITDNLINEVKIHLKKDRMVKIKLLQNYSGDKKETATELASKTNSKVGSVIGSMIVLVKK